MSDRLTRLVAGARQAFRDQMRMVLADDLAQRRQGRRLAVVRAHPPRDASGGAFHDGDEVGLAAADHDVVGMEAAVAALTALDVTAEAPFVMPVEHNGPRWSRS